MDKETPKEAVCSVFEKVNTGGVTLTTFELVTAVFAAEDFQLRDDWKKRKQRLSGCGVLKGIEGEQFLQAVTLLASQSRRRRGSRDGKHPEQSPISCKKRDVLDLSLCDYKEWADQVESGFKKAAKFLEEQCIFAEWDVPYNTQLVPLAALYVELGDALESADAKEKLERWYWSGIFSEAYGSTVETRFALDLEQIAAYIRGAAKPQFMAEASFVPERLISLRTRNSAAYKGLYALQMKSGAADWRTGRPLSLAVWNDENVDIHHIFPKKWCGENCIPKQLYDSVINKTPIDAKTNRIIGGRSPSRYLSALDQENKNLDRVLRSHWLDPNSLRNDRFAETFIERGQAMFSLINEAMGKPEADGREAFRNALTQNGLGLPDGDATVEAWRARRRAPSARQPRQGFRIQGRPARAGVRPGAASWSAASGSPAPVARRQGDPDPAAAPSALRYPSPDRRQHPVCGRACATGGNSTESINNERSSMQRLAHAFSAARFARRGSGR